MEVNLFEALKKLKSVLVIIENRIDEIEKHPIVNGGVKIPNCVRCKKQLMGH